MVVYVGQPTGQPGSADLTDELQADYGDTRTGVLILRVIASDGGATSDPTKGIALTLKAMPSVQNLVVVGSTFIGRAQNMKTGTLAFFAIYSGSAWIGIPLNLLFAFRSADKQTLVGRVIDEDTGQPIPEARIHFESTNVVLLFAATKADDAGAYIVFLEAGGAEYTVAGSNEKTCKVYELVRFDPYPDHTDIILRVPTECRIPEVVVLPGEPVEDLLNKEIGFHDYEPVKTAAVLRAQDAFMAESQAGGVLVGIGSDELILDTTPATAVSLEAILVGADGDAEFRVLQGELEIIPRRQTKGEITGHNLLDGGVLYSNGGTRLRVFARNMTAGSPANAITARATILGKKYG